MGTKANSTHSMSLWVATDKLHQTPIGHVPICVETLGYKTCPCTENSLLVMGGFIPSSNGIPFILRV